MEVDPPSKLSWTKSICVAKNKKAANMPSARSGHTFTVVGTNGFLFGGLGESSPPGPTSELFILRLGSAEHEWCALDLPGDKPKARFRHTASLIEANQLMVFGGFASSTERFNDVWIFNTVTMGELNPHIYFRVWQ